MAAAAPQCVADPYVPRVRGPCLALQLQTTLYLALRNQGPLPSEATGVLCLLPQFVFEEDRTFDGNALALCAFFFIASRIGPASAGTDIVTAMTSTQAATAPPKYFIIERFLSVQPTGSRASTPSEQDRTGFELRCSTGNTKL